MRQVQDLLKSHHSNIHNGYIIDGVGDQASLVVEAFRIANVVADAYAPGKEKDLSYGQTVIPPIVRALLELEMILIVDLWR